MNVMSFIKIVKKSMSKIFCCSGCLKLATSVFGIIDIVISAFVIFITVTFLYSYRIKINLNLLEISANNLKNVILDISIVIHSCNIITCMLLLYGNHSGRRNFLCPYVIMGFVRLMGIFLIIILLIFSGQWRLLLNCLSGMVYAICSLHVVGERDKELANQLASKLKSSLNPSAPASPRPTSAADIKKETLKIKEYTKPITPEEAKEFTKSMRMTSLHLKNKKENKDLPSRNTKNNKPSQSLKSISSNTFPSTVDFSSDNPRRSHFPVSSQISRCPLSDPTPRKCHRPKSSISLTSLDGAGPESVDSLLSKSVSAVYFSKATSPRSISSCLLSRTIESNISGSTIYIIENSYVKNNDTCKETKIDVINEQTCKLCQLCPCTSVDKGNTSVCDIRKKILFHEKHSLSEDTISQNAYAQNPTHTPAQIAQIRDNKDHGFNSKQIEPCCEKDRASISSSTHSLSKPSIMESGLQIEFDKKYSNIQGLNGVSDNRDNSCKFSQILSGEHETDTIKFDSCSPVKNMC